MELKPLDCEFTVCRVLDLLEVDWTQTFCFVGKTDEELSVVCQTERAPVHTAAREDGWKGFRVEGALDFSLIGILSDLITVLARNGISVFAVSTYNTDYVLVKQENFEKALRVLCEAGYRIQTE